MIFVCVHPSFIILVILWSSNSYILKYFIINYFPFAFHIKISALHILKKCLYAWETETERWPQLWGQTGLHSRTLSQKIYILNVIYFRLVTGALSNYGQFFSVGRDWYIRFVYHDTWVRFSEKRLSWKKTKILDEKSKWLCKHIAISSILPVLSL